MFCKLGLCNMLLVAAVFRMAQAMVHCSSLEAG